MGWQLYPTTAFERFGSEWDGLVTALDGVPFLHSRFIAPLLAHFGTGAERLACLTEGGAVTAMTIVVPRSYGVWETFQPSQLPLGPWLMRPNESFQATASSLFGQLPGFALRLGITQLDPRVYPRPPDGNGVDTLDYLETPSIVIEGTFDDYWIARDPKMRANLRRRRRKLAADGIPVRFEMLTRAEDMGEAVESYGRLESAGWKAARGTAIDAGNAQGRFYRAMLENFGVAGQACVYRYWFADRIVAVDLCIEGGDIEVWLKTTYDESLRSLSPALLLREDELKAHFTSHRIRRVEIFGKRMGSHTHWTRDSRTLYHVNVNRFAWLPRVLDLIRRR
jgi:hypothetical protein